MRVKISKIIQTELLRTAEMSTFRRVKLKDRIRSEQIRQDCSI